MTPIQQNWINFKTHFCTAHRELEETSEPIMEYSGYRQSNLVNDIVAHMYGLPFSYLPQEPTYTPIPNCAPTIALTIQPPTVANAATDYVSNILPNIINIMKQMQKLLIQMHKNQAVGLGQTSNCNTHRPPTCQEATEPRQGQSHKPLPDFSNKYRWSYGKFKHEGASCNKNFFKHQDTATFCNKRSGSTYWCT